MKSFLLIGLGRMGRHMAVQLSALGHQVMAVDEDEEKVNAVLHYVTNAQIGNSTNVEFLQELGINNYDVCFVTISDDFQSSLETTSLLKDLGARMVVSCAERDVQEKFLLRNGADAVLYPEKQLARWAAMRYGSDHLLDYIQLDDSNAIVEVTVPPEWAGRTVGEIDIRRAHNVNLLAVKRDGAVNSAITAETALPADATLLVLGEYRTLKKCFHI